MPERWGEGWDGVSETRPTWIAVIRMIRNLINQRRKPKGGGPHLLKP